MEIAFFFFILLLPLLSPSSAADEDFDVRLHLSTVTSYDAGKHANLAAYQPSAVSDECTPIHLNLVARHGTRSPTKKRIKELDRLATRLDVLLSSAKNKAQDSSLQKIPSWLFGWQSPWKGRQKGGELVIKGEEELYHLAIRVREKFPELFDQDYHPDVFSIRATQVPRASASAVAFGIGLFSGNGSLGPGRHRAFSVTSESRASDICLRFHDNCATYKEYRRSQEPAVDKLKEPILDSIASGLTSRYQLNLTREDVASLWFLCKQEASLLEITNQACGLFSASEVSLLEWTDDLEVFLLKGYGKSINYRMGVPLLKDVHESIEQAIIAKEENLSPGTYEKARLRFAHAETVIPFTCLLGLFLEGSEFERIQNEQPLDLPPKPPQRRIWAGSAVAPFAGNNMLVLFHCSGNDSNGIRTSEGSRSNYFVQVLHNEIPVPMPGCGNTDFCPYDVFKERIVNPHLKNEFESLCNSKLDLHKVNPQPPKPCSFFCKLSNWLIRPFFLKDTKMQAGSEDTEL
ncbi:multiple inositol polyphosphate phosphatase 1-like [Iris pallida]|uniref:Multiple inositol polyphosphate phosphatase 1 n=1 Tax=Iris pallida TaxID=29817 RepID=A0AAX6EKT6_IRIPA|nr:multiple inositol polyphosphate phosphatase 1-like [Iris pallida]